MANKPEVPPDMTVPADQILILLEMDFPEAMTFVGLMSAAMAHIHRMLDPMVADSASACEAVNYLLMTANTVERGGALVRRLPVTPAHQFFEEVELRVLNRIANLLAANEHHHDENVEDRTKVH